MPRIVVLGKTGQVGHELLSALAPYGDIVAPDRSRYDLSEPGSLVRIVREERPDLVFNAAADTAVDRAETETETCRIANSEAPAVLAQACEEIGVRLVHYSTDYVFDGTKGTPYTEQDPPSPVNAYGLAKLEGEVGVLASGSRHVVLRLSWVYSTRGRNFALTMLRLAREGKTIRVVDDQVGSPTYARDIADATARIAQRLLDAPGEHGGLFHLSSDGQTSWCGFAQTLLRAALGPDAPPVEPIPTEAFPTPAARPRYSVLSNEKVARRFHVRMPSWQDGVQRWSQDLPA